MVSNLLLYICINEFVQLGKNIMRFIYTLWVFYCFVFKSYWLSKKIRGVGVVLGQIKSFYYLMVPRFWSYHYVFNKKKLAWVWPPYLLPIHFLHLLVFKNINNTLGSYNYSKWRVMWGKLWTRGEGTWEGSFQQVGKMSIKGVKHGC